MATLLLRVPVGSRLTGFATPASDYDWLEVYDETKPRHTETLHSDTTAWSFSTFSRLLSKGSHNALEACFAPDHLTEVDLIRDFRHSLYASPYEVERRFRATIKGSSRSLLGKPLKAEIFSKRLAFDIHQCYRGGGRYDPTAFRRTAEGERLYALRHTMR